MFVPNTHYCTFLFHIDNPSKPPERNAGVVAIYKLHDQASPHAWPQCKEIHLAMSKPTISGIFMHPGQVCKIAVDGT